MSNNNRKIYKPPISNFSMALKLNTLGETYQEFYGRNIEQMPKLIADGRVPMNAAQLMQRRLDVRNSDDKIKSSYMDNYFDTGDAVVYNPDGRVKIVLDSQNLRDMTPKSPRNAGALILGEEVYNALEGEEFKKGKLGKTNIQMSKADVKVHPVLKVLARDQGLLNDYADYIFAEAKERLGYTENMGVYVDSPSEVTKLRAWFFDGLECRSIVDGRYYLDCSYGRFVGLAPEAPQKISGKVKVVRPNLEQVLSLANQYIPPIVQEQFKEEVKKLYQ